MSISERGPLMRGPDGCLARAEATTGIASIAVRAAIRATRTARFAGCVCIGSGAPTAVAESAHAGDRSRGATLEPRTARPGSVTTDQAVLAAASRARRATGRRRPELRKDFLHRALGRANRTVHVAGPVVRRLRARPVDAPNWRTQERSVL